MLKIGVIGKGYLGSSLEQYIIQNKIDVDIIFFRTSKFFEKKNDYRKRRLVLDTKKKLIIDKFNHFIDNCDFVLNTFSIQQDEFHLLDDNEKLNAITFFQKYISLLINEVLKKKKSILHFSSYKIKRKYKTSDSNYWYSECHKYIENKFLSKDLSVVRLKNIYGFMRDNEEKGKNLLFNSIIIKASKQEKFILNNQVSFSRDILYVEDFCNIIISNLLDSNINLDPLKLTNNIIYNIENNLYNVDINIFINTAYKITSKICKKNKNIKNKSILENISKDIKNYFA